MPSVDGNYLKMQGEALARMQVAYQAETEAQQTRAQAASQKALQRMRETVEAMKPGEGAERGLPRIGERGEGPTAEHHRREKQGKPTFSGPGPEAEDERGPSGSRLDVRA